MKEVFIKTSRTFYLQIFVFIFISLMCLVSVMSNSFANDAKSYVNKLKNHYQDYPQLETFSLNYHYLGGGDPYQAWDYQTPERYIAIRMVEIDLVNRLFVENDVHHFPDGQTFDRIQFQNDSQSLFYDRNGLHLGKRIRQQSMESFDEIKGHIFLNLDFLAIKAILEEKNVTENIKLKRISIDEGGRTQLIHQGTNGDVFEYEFDDKTLRLISINNTSKQKRYIYENYQTTNGITFARSILKYYGGVTRPSFIHYIDQLNVIDKIDPSKLQPPTGYGAIIKEKDRTLFSERIATNLYLITDEAGWRNVLFKVINDEIMVFGAPISTKLAEETIALITKEFPDKKITSVYITHPHSDHIDGLPAYAKRGITIVADSYSIKAIKAYKPFLTDINTFKFLTIEHDDVINGVTFYVLESTHAKRQSFAYFKDSGIIYQADFLDATLDKTIPRVVPNYTKTFIDFVRFKQLKVNRIVGHHINSYITVDLMNKTYDALM